MHLRLTPCIGMPVVEADTEEFLGSMSGVLIDPDSGKVEGIFIETGGFLTSTELFCSAMDILRFGIRIVVRSAGSVAPVGEFVRLDALLSDPRTVLGQKIMTESGKYVGRCRDVQFDTESMHTEWIFPKKWFRYGIALPVSDILEIKPEAIIVREIAQVEEEKNVVDVSDAAPLKEIVETGAMGRRGRMS